jgi:hypothetical protein
MGRLAVPYWKQLGRLPTSFCSSSTLTYGIVYISLTPPPVSVYPELSQHSTIPALSLPLSPFGITCSATYVPWYPRDLHKFHISPLDHNRLNITTLASLFDLSKLPFASPFKINVSQTILNLCHGWLRKRVLLFFPSLQGGETSLISPHFLTDTSLKQFLRRKVINFQS